MKKGEREDATSVMTATIAVVGSEQGKTEEKKICPCFAGSKTCHEMTNQSKRNCKGKEMRFWMAEFFPFFHDSANDRNRVSSCSLLLSPLVPVRVWQGKWFHSLRITHCIIQWSQVHVTRVSLMTHRRKSGKREMKHQSWLFSFVFQMLWRRWLWWCERREIEMKNT